MTKTNPPKKICLNYIFFQAVDHFKMIFNPYLAKIKTKQNKQNKTKQNKKT